MDESFSIQLMIDFELNNDIQSFDKRGRQGLFGIYDFIFAVTIKRLMPDYVMSRPDRGPGITGASDHLIPT